MSMKKSSFSVTNCYGKIATAKLSSPEVEEPISSKPPAENSDRSLAKPVTAKKKSKDSLKRKREYKKPTVYSKQSNKKNIPAATSVPLPQPTPLNPSPSAPKRRKVMSCSGSNVGSVVEEMPLFKLREETVVDLQKAYPLFDHKYYVSSGAERQDFTDTSLVSHGVVMEEHVETNEGSSISSGNDGCTIDTPMMVYKEETVDDGMLLVESERFYFSVFVIFFQVI